MAEPHKASGTERVLHHGRSSVRARFIQPVVVKQGSLFPLCTDDGDIRADSDQGLYFHDMRYLCAQSLCLGAQPPVSLLADVGSGHAGIFKLTNSDLQDGDGTPEVRKETLGIRREKRLGDDFEEQLRIQNYGTQRAAFTLSLSYQADFAEMFAVRGTHPGRRGALHPPEWHGAELRFRYDGADGHRRWASLRFSREPDERQGGGAA